jgi:hypothetical protein
LSDDEVALRLAEVSAHLTRAHEVLRQAQKEASAVGAVAEGLQTEVVRRRLATLSAADMRDAEVRAWVFEEGWRNGRGSGEVEGFIRAWVRGVHPDLRHRGWRGDTEEPMVSVGLGVTPGVTDLAALEVGLLELRELLGGPGSWTVQVSEHTCSEFGSYRLEVQDAGRAVLVRKTYGRDSQVAMGTLAEVLGVIERDHPQG